MPELDITNLSTAKLCGLLNSTKLGEVTTHGKLDGIRQRMGLFKIMGTSERRSHFIKFVGGLIDLVDQPKKEKKSGRQRAAEAQRQESLSVRDIAPLPAIANPNRRNECEEDFQLFCETYFPQTFTLDWSDDHVKVINKIEASVIHGGLFALAMPRGSGKTTLAECACLWAVLYGHRRFVAIVGATETHATEMLESVKTEFETNELLYEDFPESIHPIVCLEGIVHRCNGQLFEGESTHMTWTNSEIVIATIPGSNSSGGIIRVAGITGRIRGMKFKRPDGKTIRPELVIIDDPQTDESAQSLVQCAKRERVLAGAILGLAGPGKKISGIMPCTVIRPDDMADRILNMDIHPRWQGERTKMVYAFPTAEKLWDDYRKLYEDGLRSGAGIEEANEFYRARRDAMDAGSAVGWPARFTEDELSALQHAMNLKFRDETAFFAEYQNEPLPSDDGRADDLTPDDIMAKLNGYDRRTVPGDATHVTAFIDVQQACLYYCVVAWTAEFTGYVIDYGAWPEQSANYFVLANVRKTLSTTYRGAGLEGSIMAGLRELIEKLMLTEWPRSDGGVMRIAFSMIDANWGASTDTVYDYCRVSPYGATVFPSHGRGVGASAIPFAEYRRQQGDRIGHNWRMPSTTKKRAVRHILYDTNYWKTFVYNRLAVAVGDPGCLSLWGRKTTTHRMVAEHVTAEYRVRTFGRGREVDEWKHRPERNDNHLFDCIVGASVAASVQGVSLPGSQPANPKRKTIKLSEIQRKRYG
jgi:hypothetical protein